MVTALYFSMFAVSMLLTIVYAFFWHRHFDVNITILFILISISNLGFWFRNISPDLPQALLANKITYIGGCFLPYFILMCVLNLCDIRVGRFLKIVPLVISVLVYFSVLSVGYYPWFYKETAYIKANGVVRLQTTYGLMHTVHYMVLSVYLIAAFAVIIYSFFKKRQVSHTILFFLFVPELIAIMGYFGNRLFGFGFEIIPITYVFAEVVYLLIVHRMELYNVSDTVIDSMVQTGDTGFLSLDFKFHYLGSNETARKFLPELELLNVDLCIETVDELKGTVLAWIRRFEKDNSLADNLYEKKAAADKEEDRIYQVTVNYLYDGRRKRGYQLFFTDDTKNQKYISLMNSYNAELEVEVEEKTRHIIDMHDNLILGMATMVESRDNSTGGHIRRTSEVVRLLIEETKKDNALKLSEKFCKDLIKAAPMHDIGKIAVDDVILRKPGRFTDEEFEKMKAHAAEGAKIVHEILKETDDEHFKMIAENVAHYHHERWDGSGYPNGLKGEEIPLEARIMAIADVYDALVSKRVYKESMSFTQADSIIMEGMGKHFDKRLEPYYVRARARLEEYYSD
ncbi:MAG: HD domain-containing protein [Lachnospiraceae bacterium]|nr:HD domain-containing protein [Lachnospiraceae bacterium]